MNRYLFIRRLRGPAILLLIGGVELLHQLGVLSRAWSWIWTLLLIMLGVFWLAERAALAGEGYPPGCYSCDTPYPGSYPGSPYQGGPYPGAPYSAAAPAAPQQPGTAIVPAQTNDFGSGSNGGQI